MVYLVTIDCYPLLVSYLFVVVIAFLNSFPPKSNCSFWTYAHHATNGGLKEGNRVNTPP